jgi:hypothetical protein
MGVLTLVDKRHHSHYEIIISQAIVNHKHFYYKNFLAEKSKKKALMCNE